MCPAGIVLLFLFSVVPSVPAQALTVNAIQLDNGTCGQNLQEGSNATASPTTTPSFLLTGDGGLSSYSASVDGRSLGTFKSDGYGNVCILDTTTLSEGSHQLTAQELAPHPSNVVSPFNFEVEAVPLASPTGLTLDPNSDTGVQGDDTTSYTDPDIDGLSTPSVPIRVLENGQVVGGALARSSGQWTVATNLAAGVNQLTAVTVNPAGVESAPSAPLSVTVITAPPAAPPTPTLDPDSGSGNTADVADPTVDGAGTLFNAPIAVFADGVKTGSTVSNGSGGWRFILPVLATGAHSVTATVTDGAGNVSALSAPLTFTVGAVSPTVPSAPALSAPAGNGSVSLSWNVPANGGSAITAYDVYRGTSSGAESLLGTVTTTSDTDTSVTNGTTYYYEVSAINGVGQGPLSAEVAATPVASGQAPSIVSSPSVSATIHQTFTFTVTAVGFPAPAFSESGALPHGIHFNVVTGKFSGMAKAGTKGSHKVVITAYNSIGSAVQIFTLRVKG
jgi:hypothetical protein